MSKRNVVFGGHVVSRHDGDLHYIPARRVAELWGIDLSNCYLIDKDDLSARAGLRVAEAEVYHPDPTGQYMRGSEESGS